MTQEDKNLLLQDLCARLPYGVMCKIQTCFVFEDGTLRRGSYDKILDLDTVTEIESWYAANELEKLKPYLRPMSSMTEEEKETYEMFFNEDGLLNTSVDTYLDWLLENHFDYRGLIPRGLALPATEEMYKR